MRTLTLFLFLLLTAALGLAQTTDLQVTKSGNDVVLSWSGGTADYLVAYSHYPDFSYGNVTLNEANSGTTENHLDALLDTKNYFYDVTGQGEDNRALTNGGYIPPPQPVILDILEYTTSCTTTSINSGSVGDTICLKVKNPNTTPEANLVLFNGIPADPPSTLVDNLDGTYTLQVVIPDLATSGVLSLRAHAINSNTKDFFIVWESGFQDLSSMAFEEAAGSVWVGDRGSADDLIEIASDGTKTVRAGIGQIVISDLESGHYIYYSNSTFSSYNQGTTRKYDTTTNTETTWRSAGAATTDPVQCRAIGVDHAQTDRIFYADGYNGTIRRIPYSGSKDNDYGNLGGVLLNDPAGLRTDASGVLYATTSTSLLKIASDSNVTTLNSALSGGAGIDITEGGMILVAEETGNDVSIVDPTNEVLTFVAKNLNGPVAVADVQKENRRYTYVAEPTRILSFPDLEVRMEPKTNTKIILSAVHGYPFPSPLQTQGGIMEIRARVIPPRAGVTLYFTLHDPPDTSPYVTGTDNDNLCGEGGVLSPASAVTNGDGIATTYLSVGGYDCAGNNWYVTTHLASGGPEVARTGIITAWKRVYVERDRMFRTGSWPTLQIPSGANVITLDDVSMFSIGDQVQIFDIDNQDAPFGEKRTVIGVHSGNKQITLDSSVTQAYYSSPDADGNIISYVGKLVIPEEDSFYSANLGFIRQLYDPAYVEFVFPKKGSGPVPNPGWANMISVSTTELYNFSSKWWHPDGRHKRNYFHLIGSERLAQGDSTTLGVTVDYYDLNKYANCSYVFVEAIADHYAGQAFENVVKTATDHELGHQFHLTATCTTPSTGHCTNAAYSPPADGQKCVMQKQLTDTDKVVRFCLEHILTDANACWDDSIRTIDDDL